MAIIMHVCITNMQCLLVACGFRTKSSRVSYNISDGGLRGGNFHNLSGKITGRRYQNSTVTVWLFLIMLLFATICNWYASHARNDCPPTRTYTTSCLPTFNRTAANCRCQRFPRSVWGRTSLMLGSSVRRELGPVLMLWLLHTERLQLWRSTSPLAVV